MGCTPLFLNAEPHSTGTKRERQRALADGALDVVGDELLVVEVLLHELVVLGGDDVEQLGPPLLGLGLELGGDGDLVAVLALVLALVPHEGLHA